MTFQRVVLHDSCVDFEFICTLKEKMNENYMHIQHYMRFYFRKVKKITLQRAKKKRSVPFIEKVPYLRLGEIFGSGLQV